MRAAGLHERECHRDQAGGAGADEDRLSGGARGILRPRQSRCRRGIGPCHRDPDPDDEHERGEVRGAQNGDRPRGPLNKSEDRCSDSDHRTDDDPLADQSEPIGAWVCVRG